MVYYLSVTAEQQQQKKTVGKKIVVTRYQLSAKQGGMSKHYYLALKQHSNGCFNSD